MKNILVSDIMTRNPEIIKPDTTILDCAKKMVQKRIRSLVIVDGNKLVGFISQRDVLWAMIKKSKKDISKIKAIDIGVKKVTTIKPDATLEEALKKMKKTKFRRLPVVYNKELVGIVTMRDILSFHPEFYPELDEMEKIREETEKLKRIKKAKNREFMHEGECEECGATDILQKIDGRLLCSSCASSM
jgi:CBS domain-containing protein/predicted Zn-ribbon and HTH transcriptional regulator